MQKTMTFDSAYHKQCKRCGRKLKTKESQDLGMGKICYKKYLQENHRRKLIRLQKGDNLT